MYVECVLQTFCWNRKKSENEKRDENVEIEAEGDGM